MSISNLRVNHLSNPIGIFPKFNLFSFLTDEEGPFFASIYFNGEVLERREVSLTDRVGFYFDKDLEFGKEYQFVVESQLSKCCLDFETAEELDKNFITPVDDVFSPIMYKSFTVKKKIKKGRLYITGLGLYRAHINGKRVGENYLSPGFNDYDGYLRYQTYDITNLLEEENEISVNLGDGWYKGRIGIDKPFDKGGNVFGTKYKLNALIVISYDDSSEDRIITDDSWEYSNSFNIENSIYDGEVIDYTKELLPRKKVVKNEENYILKADFGAGIVKHEEIKPTLYISPKNEKILDFGQNFAGIFSFKGKIERGAKVRFRTGEVLQKECFYRDNLRTALSRFEVTGDGKERTYEPMFTYFGFRYILVEGLEEVNVNDFTGIVLYTDLDDTLECTTDNVKINRLMKNAYWGQRSNFLDVPTDCPQRDERLGWTADTQVFVNTACYQMDSYIFYKKYLHDLREDQVMYYNGDIPMYSPSLKRESGNGGAVWADSGTIIPWNLYMNYGDKMFLGYCYGIMKDYVETLILKDKEQGDRGLILYGFTFGDWLAQDGVCPQSLMGGTDNGFIMSVYYYNSINLTAKAAKELGIKEDYERYSALSKKIYSAILDEYFAPSGKLALSTQTSYVLSLFYGIYRNKERVIEDFRSRLNKDFYKMKTGFTGTPLMLLTLFDSGMDDDAYRILFNEECPGWLYAINLGATTIWERWNSLLPDGTISGINMNSLNHYSYGSVCEAIYSRIAGLKNLSPGWKEVLINPHFNYRMKEIHLKFNSPFGEYKVEWKVNGEKIKVDIKIPVGGKANVVLLDEVNTVVGGGEYSYTINAPFKINHPFDLDTPLIDIVANEKARMILKECLPHAYNMVTGENEEFKVSSSRLFQGLPMFGATPEMIEVYEKKLKEITI